METGAVVPSRDVCATGGRLLDYNTQVAHAVNTFCPATKLITLLQ